MLSEILTSVLRAKDILVRKDELSFSGMLSVYISREKALGL